MQVGIYIREQYPDEKCPNCGLQEMANNLIICPDADRTRQLTEHTDQLSKRMDKDNNMKSELAYWLPKYILMR